MQKETDFAICLGKFFSTYLMGSRKVSPATFDTYRITYIKLFTFFETVLGIAPDKIKLKDLTRENIEAFIAWLENHEENSPSTCNLRLASINSFVSFLIYERPEFMHNYQKILSIKQKKTAEKEISYLKEDGIKLLLQQVDIDSTDGLRDMVILQVLITTGIRVSELINIHVYDVSFSDPKAIKVVGKGNKARFVPLDKHVLPYLKQYMKKYGLDRPERSSNWLFFNHSMDQFTRQGITYIVKKYGDEAREIDPSLIPKDLSPHKLRHTTAMLLVNNKMDLIYIRDLMGHVSVKTTEVYAKADVAKKQKAIEEASKNILPNEIPVWQNNNGLMNTLMKMGKKNKDFM